jgi:hypothetical protein
MSACYSFQVCEQTDTHGTLCSVHCDGFNSLFSNGVFLLYMNFNSRGASNVQSKAFGKYVDTCFILHSIEHVWYVAWTWNILQPYDITDIKRFASVSMPIYFILAQFMRHRIRHFHTICFGYLKIDPLNFHKLLDGNEGFFF